MPIYRLLQNSAFEPEAVAAMTFALEDVCKTLGLADRTDALRDLVARTIIDIAQTGVRDPFELRDAALSALKT